MKLIAVSVQHAVDEIALVSRNVFEG